MPPRGIPGTGLAPGGAPPLADPSARQRSRMPMDEAFSGIRMAVAQPHLPVAMIVEQTDMLCRESPSSSAPGELVEKVPRNEDQADNNRQGGNHL